MIAKAAVTMAIFTLAACLTPSGAQAQGFTFGAPVPDEGARPHIRAKPPVREGKTRSQIIQCRQERHQVYDADGRLQWRTIRVCG